MLDDAAFEAFLTAHRPHPPVHTLPGLDGYLTALIIGPKFIEPTLWIPAFAGDSALGAAAETAEHQAVQTIVANYNRISNTLGETPALYRPRFPKLTDGTYDSFDWSTGFLFGTEFTQPQWRPVIRGHAATGDIIAPIRKISGAAKSIPETDMLAVAEAIVRILTFFMPRRVKDARRR